MPPHLTSAALSAIPSLRHGFFTRQGGRSAGIFDSLNCGPGSGDQTANVAANRALVAAALGVDRVVTAYQVHSTDVVVVDGPFAGEAPRADAIVTATPGLAIGIVTADCGPILFAAADGSVAGVAHAGWKGALYGIVENTVAAMETLGASRSTIYTSVGPCIGQPSYQVGGEFRDNFLAVDAAFESWFVADGDKYRFDLPGFIAMRLRQAGVAAVDELGCDTYPDAKRFFSYRRTTHAGEADYGRQISAMAIGSPA